MQLIADPFQFENLKRPDTWYTPALHQMIKTWQEKACELRKQDCTDPVWKKYSRFFVDIIVNRNKNFPEFIPVGYVLYVYFSGLKDYDVRLENQLPAFNLFLFQHGPGLQDAYDNKEEYQWNQEDEPESDLTEALYGPPK